MTLFDDTTAHNSGSSTAVATEVEPTVPELTSTERRLTAQNQDPVPSTTTAQAEEASHVTASDDKPANEDFASALENFTTETEEAVGEDRVIKGTVLKLTSTHVVVDVGAKSEGMLPLSEVSGSRGQAQGKTRGRD